MVAPSNPLRLLVFCGVRACLLSLSCRVVSCQLEGVGLENVVAEAYEVRMELAAMGSELLEKMARSPQVTSRLPAVSTKMKG